MISVSSMTNSSAEAEIIPETFTYHDTERPTSRTSIPPPGTPTTREIPSAVQCTKCDEYCIPSVGSLSYCSPCSETIAAEFRAVYAENQVDDLKKENERLTLTIKHMRTEMLGLARTVSKCKCKS